MKNLGYNSISTTGKNPPFPVFHRHTLSFLPRTLNPPSSPSVPHKVITLANSATWVSQCNLPSGVIKNKEDLFIWEYNQTLYAAAAVILALWLPAIIAAGANIGSGRTGIPGRGWHLAHTGLHPALPCSGQLVPFQHLAERYRSQWSLGRQHYFSVWRIMVL